MKRLILSVFVMLALAACNEEEDVGDGDGETTTEEGTTVTE